VRYGHLRLPTLSLTEILSAAMVVASTLVFLAVNNKLEGVTKGQLVEMAMENEKRVGVNSGGYVPGIFACLIILIRRC
jgi:hypothetical protein